MRTTLLLDLDGTLADSIDVARDVYRRFLTERHRQPSDAEFDALNGPPLGVVVERLRATHDLRETAAMLLARYETLFDEAYRDVAPMPGARALLTAARRAGMACAVVTSNTAARANDWLSRRGLLASMDAVVAGPVGRGKPWPDPYLEVLRVLGRRSDEAIAIEDSTQGASAATGAAIFTLGLNRRGDDMAWPAGVCEIRELEEAIAWLTASNSTFAASTAG